jgi:hypothetical protein
MTVLKGLARQAICFGLKPEDIGPISTFADDEFMRCYIGHLRGFESPASFGVFRCAPGPCPESLGQGVRRDETRSR